MAHILVVDDESGITMVIKKMLIRLKYTVLTAKNGKEALKKLSVSPVDLLITDLILPDMDGLLLISEIRQKFPDVRIIAMSDDGDNLSQETLHTYCLTKPFMLHELTDIVSLALADNAAVA